MLPAATERTPWRGWLLCLLAAMLPAVLSTAEAARALPFGEDDPDSWLRLTLLRDWLQGASWFHDRYASNAPFAPMQIHWTRPLDLLLAALTLPQRPWVELPRALLNAALIYPLVCRTGMVWLWLLLMHRLHPQRYAGPILVMLLIITPIMVNYFQPGNADHHALLALLWVAAVVCILAQPRAGWLLGLVLALMLWISTEAIVLIATIYAIMALRWVWQGGREVVQPLRQLTVMVAAGSILTSCIEHPYANWLDATYDVISLRYALPLTLAAMVVWLCHAADPRSRRARLLLGGCAAALALGVVALVDPLFLHGPMAQLDPYMRDHFLPRVQETQSIVSKTPLRALAMLLLPGWAMLILLRCACRTGGVIASHHAKSLLALLLITTGLMCVQQRWFYYCYPIALPVLALWLAAGWQAQTRRRGRTAWLALALFGPLACMATSITSPTAHQRESLACVADARRLLQRGDLNGYPAGTLLINANLGTEALFFTPHRIIASNYHREAEGTRDLDRMLTTRKPSTLQRLATARHLQLALICPDSMVTQSTLLYQLWRMDRSVTGWQRQPLPEGQWSSHPPAIFLVKTGAAAHSRDQ